MTTKRIWLRDGMGNYFRICSVANPKDLRGEYYVKIMFPDTKDIRLKAAMHDEDGRVMNRPEEFNSVSEFTCHYLAGVSHYKNKESRFDGERTLPTNEDSPVRHLLRFMIYDLAPFKPQSPFAIGTNDFVIPCAFDKIPRSLEFILILAADHDLTMKSSPDAIHGASHWIELEDKSVGLFISEAVWLRKPVLANSAFEIFRYEDPTLGFVETSPSKVESEGVRSLDDKP